MAAGEARRKILVLARRTPGTADRFIISMVYEYWKSLSRRRRQWVAWLGGLFLLYTLVGFLVLPALIRWQALKQLPAVLKREVAVRQVRVNPWTLSLAIRGFSVTEPDGSRFVAWDEFYLNFQLSSLVRWAWTFKEVRLVNPFGEVILFEDGRPNFANLVEGGEAEAVPAESTGGVPRIGVGRLVVTNGVFVFEDRTLRSTFRTEYRPINLTLNAFKTRRDARSPHAFTAESDAGKRIAWSGSMTVQPLRGEGMFEMTKIDLARYHPYLEESIRARLEEAQADVNLDYRFALGTNGTDLVVSNGVIRLANVRFTDPDSEDDPVAVETIGIDQIELDLRARSARVEAIEIGGARIHARRDRDGAMNLVSLFVPLVGAEEESASATSSTEGETEVGAWELDVERLRVRASLTIEDFERATPFRTTLTPIEIGVDGFSTRPDAEGAFRFEIESEAAEKLAGEGVFSVNPPGSSGEVRLADLELARYAAYLEPVFRGRIGGGRVAMGVPYRLEVASGALEGGVSNGVLKVSDLAVSMPDAGDPVIALPLFGVEGVEADLKERRARIGRVHSSEGTIEIRRAKDGRLNLAELVAMASEETNIPSPAKVSSDPAWAVGVDEIRVDGYTIKVRDESVPRPAEFSIDDLALEVRGSSSRLDQPVETALSLRLNQLGGLSVRGSVTPEPAAAALEVTITNLDVSVFGPYVEAYAHLGIGRGFCDLAGEARLRPSDQGPEFEFVGGLKLREFMSTDLTVLEPLVEWDELDVAGIELKSRPPRLAVDEIRWNGLAGHLIIDAEGRLNVAGVMTPPGAPDVGGDPVERPASSGAEEPASVLVGILALEGAAFTFEDRSITPKASVAIQELTGTVRGISSAADSMAEVDLSAKVDGQSPLSIQGRMNPLAQEVFMDMAIVNRDLQLSPFSPYLEKYAGYPLNRGRLNANLRYQVQGEQLSAENEFQIEQLTLGSRNNSPDATSLPVKLGIALLKDREGRIDLKIPVQGRLDDPGFRIGPLIGKVVVNTITKAATSPFSLLGALVGGGEELSYVEFEPGGTNVVEGELEKLEKLARALEQRPALNVDLEGGVNPARDGPFLRLARLREQIRTHRLKELEVRGDSMANAPGFVIDPIDYERLLRIRFHEEFGDDPMVGDDAPAGNGLSGPAAIEPAVEDQIEPKRGWIRRSLAKVGLGRKGGRSSAGAVPRTEEAPAMGAEFDTERMETLLAEQVSVGDEDYLELMSARTQWVRDALTQQGGVAADRLFLVAPKLASPEAAGESRVQLLLN